MKPLSQDSKNQKIVEQELRLLARVSSALSEISTKSEGSPDFDEALINLRDQIAEAKPEDIGALVEQMTRISAIAQRYGKGRDLPVNPSSPYFAHLCLDEDDRTRDVLIGKRGFIDRGHQIQIVDWRNAPVSRIYYRYEEGDDYEEHFGDNTLEGIIQARRSLTINESRLCRIGCPQGTLVADDQGKWYEAESLEPSSLKGGQGTASRPPAVKAGQAGSKLGLHSGPTIRGDKHLPEIAALIDPIQFDLITKPESGLVVLQGGAGSGKTTVALHRVAYLNFAMPGRFRADRVMVLVLSRAMVRYVERVLPSLGVRGVPVLTAQRWFERMRRKIIQGAPKTYNDDTPQVVMRFKKHPALLEICREYVRDQVHHHQELLREALEAQEDGARVLARWEEMARLAPVPRCKDLRQWITGQKLGGVTLHQAQVTLRNMDRRLRDTFSDWGELFTDRALLGRAVQRHCPEEFSERDIDRFCKWCAGQSEEGVIVSQGPTREQTSFPFQSVDHDNPYISLDGQDERHAAVSGHLDREDDCLLLYLAWLKHGVLQVPGKRPLRYEHLVVDEAQDLSVMEIKVLLECTSKVRSVTLAGDTAQRLVFDNAFTSWEALLKRLGVSAATNTTLRLGYRSTQEIMEMARQLVPDSMGGSDLTPVRRGAAVELHCFNEQGEAVAMLAESLRSLMMREPRASVALISRYPEQARLYAQALRDAEVPGLRLVMNHEFSFKVGIDVTDVTQVKGLEFDYVVLLDVTAANYNDSLESRHLLYIAATRAAHQLWIMSVGVPSPLLPRDF